MQKLETKTTEELLQILSEGYAKHEESVIMDVEVILQKRDVHHTFGIRQVAQSVSVPTSRSEKSEETNEEQRVFVPIVVAVIIFIGSYMAVGILDKSRGLDQDQRVIFAVGLIAVHRIIVIYVIDHYVRKFAIRGSWWYVLGLIFGFWSLTLFNIYLMFRPSTKNKKTDSWR